MGKTQSEKKAERKLKYDSNRGYYDRASSIALAGLSAIIDEVEKANEVFPEIFTGDLIKNINRTVDFIYRTRKNDTKLMEEHYNLMQPFENLITKMKEAMKPITEKVTVDMVQSLNYGESIMLDDIHELYHYTEEDIIVINKLEDDEHTELYQVLIDYETLQLEFESLI